RGGARQPAKFGERAASWPVLLEDPPLPPVLLDRPALLLHFQPPPRRAALVHAGLVLGNVALVPAIEPPASTPPDHRGRAAAPGRPARCRRRRPPAGRGDHGGGARSGRTPSRS